MRCKPSYYLPIVIFIAILFSSCATIFNNPSQKVRFSTNIDAEKITVNNRQRRLTDGKTTLDLDRRKDPLVIEVKDKDSVYKINIKSRDSFTYLYYAIFTAGLSTIFERNNPKRYGYRKYIYVEKKGNAVKLYRFAPTTKGTININFSLPHGNYFHLNTTEGYKDIWGFFGLSAGADYFYKQNTYLSLQGGASANLLAPFPAPVKYGGKHDHASARFVNIRNNHTIHSFDIGYGLSLSRYNWLQHNDYDPLFVTKETKSSAIGLSLTTQYRITKNFRMGLLYQPSFFTLDKTSSPISDRNNYSYQHLLSLELAFKFLARKGK